MNHDPQPSVLAVSSNPHNLDAIGKVLETAGHAAILIGSLHALDLALDEVRTATADIGVALVDLTGLDASVWLRCERLREARVPLVIVGARRSPELDVAGRQHSAATVLVKPVAVRELTRIIDVLMGP